MESSSKVSKYERFCQAALANGKEFEVLPNHIKVSSALENISVQLEMSQYGIQSIVSSPDLLLESCKELEHRLQEKHPEITRIGFHSWKNQINFFITKPLDQVECKLQVTCPLQKTLVWKDVEVSIDARPAIKEEIKTTIIDLAEHAKTKKDTEYWYITKLKARIKDQPYQTSTLLWRFLLTDLETKETHSPLFFIQMNGGESYASKLLAFFEQWEQYCQRDQPYDLPACLVQLLGVKKKHGEEEKTSKKPKTSIGASGEWNSVQSENVHIPSLMQIQQQLFYPVNNVNTSLSSDVHQASAASSSGQGNSVEESGATFSMSIPISKIMQYMQFKNESNLKKTLIQE